MAKVLGLVGTPMREVELSGSCRVRQSLSPVLCFRGSWRWWSLLYLNQNQKKTITIITINALLRTKVHDITDALTIIMHLIAILYFCFVVSLYAQSRGQPVADNTHALPLAIGERITPENVNTLEELKLR